MSDFWKAEMYASPPARALGSLDLATDPYSDNAVDITFFVSCYNESRYLARTLDTLRAAAGETGLSYEILMIDDMSRDDSVAVAKRYIDAHPEEPIWLRVNPFNKGWAQNYIDAAFIGRGRYLRAICGDNSEPKETIVSVLREVGKADIIAPYYATSVGRSLTRRVISRLFTLIVSAISGHRLHYYNGLAVHLRHNVMRWHPNTRGFGFQADIMCQLLDLGFSCKEVPVTTIEMREEKSNAVTVKNLLSVTHTLLDLLLRRAANWVYSKR